MFKKLLCSLHMHNWNKWEQYTISGFNVINEKQYEYSEEWQKRTCLSCNYKQIERI